MSHKIVPELINPKSIVVIGGSNNLHKPGGKIVQNILEGTFSGKLFIVNPKESSVQGVSSFPAIKDLPGVDLAILAIPVRSCIASIEELIHKGSKAFIVISAGFSEEGEEGAVLERHMVSLVEKVNGTLIGPNCIGVITPAYQAVFTRPIPKLSKAGVIWCRVPVPQPCLLWKAGCQKVLRFREFIQLVTAP
jgi:acetate---CoA ligase (ADP-forming)